MIEVNRSRADRSPFRQSRSRFVTSSELLQARSDTCPYISTSVRARILIRCVLKGSGFSSETGARYFYTALIGFCPLRKPQWKQTKRNLATRTPKSLGLRKRLPPLRLVRSTRLLEVFL